MGVRIMVNKFQAVYAHEKRRVIFLIDSKSFYASVECVERMLNPLRALLVVMSHQENQSGGLVLAASPMAKKRLGISNVTRQKDVPDVPGLIKAEPRMNLYIQKNLVINDIYRQYVDDDHMLPYSIDEVILDMTEFWHLFGDSPAAVARRIQTEVLQKTGVYLSVGIGDSPVLAKLALDLDAKSAPHLLAQWHYEDVSSRLWPIQDLGKVWGIGHQTAKKLQTWGIQSMGDVAAMDPYQLREQMGLMGEQLYATAWGIDRSELTEAVVRHHRSYSNSQVLPYDYHQLSEVQIVLQEMADQVASRIRAQKLVTGRVNIYLGAANQGVKFYNRHDRRHNIHQSLTIRPTNSSQILMSILNQMLRKVWTGQSVRYLGVSFSDLQDQSHQQLDLFQGYENDLNQNRLDTTIDQIRQRFGNGALLRGLSLAEGGTAIARANLVGGHNGGNAYE